MKAREVFRDCQYATQQLGKAIDEQRLDDAKVLWFASLAMLRAIGHVLQKVDVKTYGVVFEDRLHARYKQWKQDPIFADFIERERNNILKEYDSSLTEQSTTENDYLLLEDGGRLQLEDGGSMIIGTTTITTLIKSRGIYSGSSPVTTLSKALEWWDQELSSFEQSFS
jgi:hypothetical protein